MVLTLTWFLALSSHFLKKCLPLHEQGLLGFDSKLNIGAVGSYGQNNIRFYTRKGFLRKIGHETNIARFLNFALGNPSILSRI